MLSRPFFARKDAIFSRISGGNEWEVIGRIADEEVVEGIVFKAMSFVFVFEIVARVVKVNGHKYC